MQGAIRAQAGNRLAASGPRSRDLPRLLPGPEGEWRRAGRIRKVGAGPVGIGAALRSEIRCSCMKRAVRPAHPAVLTSRVADQRAVVELARRAAPPPYPHTNSGALPLARRCTQRCSYNRRRHLGGPAAWRIRVELPVSVQFVERATVSPTAAASPPPATEFSVREQLLERAVPTPRRPLHEDPSYQSGCQLDEGTTRSPATLPSRVASQDAVVERAARTLRPP